MCLMHGCPQPSSDRAARGCPRTPTVAAAAPRTSIDSHSRRPVVVAMLTLPVCQFDRRKSGGQLGMRSNRALSRKVAWRAEGNGASTASPEFAIEFLHLGASCGPKELYVSTGIAEGGVALAAPGWIHHSDDN